MRNCMPRSKTGALIGWRYDVRTNFHTYDVSAAPPPGVLEMTSGRNAVPPYRLGSAEVLLHVELAALRTGAYRSLAAAPNVFAIESFLDELAHASKQDPIAFRLRMIDDPRLRHVLETVRDRSGWNSRWREPGYGFGAACAIYHGTYIAEIAEVSVSPDGGGAAAARMGGGRSRPAGASRWRPEPDRKRNPASG